MSCEEPSRRRPGRLAKSPYDVWKFCAGRLASGVPLRVNALLPHANGKGKPFAVDKYRRPPYVQKSFRHVANSFCRVTRSLSHLARSVRR